MSSENTLVSLSLLKLNIDQGGDYLEYLRPFILHILGKGQEDPVTDENISSELLQEFGLTIPCRTVQIFLERLVQQGILSTENKVFTVIKEIEHSELSRNRTIAKRKINAVVNYLIEYARESHERDLSDNDAFNALIQFLSKFSIHCIRSYLQGTTLPNDIGNENWQFLLVCNFVNNLNNSQPEQFENFIVMVEGHMLANALLCPDLIEVTTLYSEVTFYLDTPLLLQLIGLEGELRRESSNELLRLLQQLDGRVACFSHTLQELKLVIQGSAEYIDDFTSGRGGIVREARRTKKTKSDLLLCAENVTEILSELKIDIQNTPDYIEDFQIDETVFEKFLTDDIFYYNPKAVLYDINSVRSIYVLRENHPSYSIEKCTAIFVTSNTTFAKVAFKYGLNINASKNISTVISGFSLANIAWLKVPLKSPELPQKEVLAFSYAAAMPDDDLLEKVLKEVEKLEKEGRVSARNHQLLRSCQPFQDKLTAFTLGEEKALTPQTVREVAEKIKADIIGENRVQLLDMREELQEEKSKTKAEKSKIKAITDSITEGCDKKARLWAMVIFIILSICVILGAFLGLVNVIYGIGINRIVSFVFTVLTILGSLFGITVAIIRKKLIVHFRKKCIQQKCKKFKIDCNEII